MGRISNLCHRSVIFWRKLRVKDTCLQRFLLDEYPDQFQILEEFALLFCLVNHSKYHQITHFIFFKILFTVPSSWYNLFRLFIKKLQCQCPMSGVLLTRVMGQWSEVGINTLVSPVISDPTSDHRHHTSGVHWSLGTLAMQWVTPV